jgi:hypothetical protein
MLRPIAENTFAEFEFEECWFAEKCICGITYLRNYVFAELLICRKCFFGITDAFKFSGKMHGQLLVARGG